MRDRGRLRAEQWSDAQHAAMEYLTALKAANNEYAHLARRRRSGEVQHDAHLDSSTRQAEEQRSDEQSGVRQRLLVTLSQANQARRLDAQSRPAAPNTRNSNSAAADARLRSHTASLRLAMCTVSLPGAQQRQLDAMAELDAVSAEVCSLAIAAHDQPSAIEQRGRTRTLEDTRQSRNAVTHELTRRTLGCARSLLSLHCPH